TLAHSEKLIPPIPLCIAMAAPDSPAIRLWLSLVGIPNMEAATLYTTIENRAAQSAIKATFVSPTKSTILLIVDATALLICVISSTPRKLNTALIMMAVLTLRHLVAIHVAIAFGASVQPFTKITPSVSRTVTIRTGLEKTCSQKPENVTS